MKARVALYLLLLVSLYSYCYENQLYRWIIAEEPVSIAKTNGRESVVSHHARFDTYSNQGQSQRFRNFVAPSILENERY